MKTVIKSLIAVVVLAGAASAQEFGTMDLSAAGGVPAVKMKAVPPNQMGTQELVDLLNSIKLSGCAIRAMNVGGKAHVDVTKLKKPMTSEQSEVLVTFAPAAASVTMVREVGPAFVWDQIENLTSDMVRRFTLVLNTDLNGRIIRLFAGGSLTNIRDNYMVVSSIECGKTIDQMNAR